jgi:hypothetical protein
VSDRPQRLRRDLNDMLFYRDGRPEASKFWSNVGCCIVAYWMVATPPRVWQDWTASAVIALLLIAPDIVKKIMVRRVTGVSTEKIERSSKTTEGAKP